MQPIHLAEDRSLAVPPGRRIVTDYVHIDRMRFGCRARMAVGDVDRAYQRRLQLGDHQPWPCPRGEWDGAPEAPGSRFMVIDGRHDVTAALMLGQEWVLVAWPEARRPSQAGLSEELPESAGLVRHLP